MTAISDKIHLKGGRFIEAPVSGSKVPAETGQLIFLCGGDADVFEHPVVGAALDVMGKAKFFFGEVGQGSRVKLVVNMIMGTMMSGFAEGLALGRASEIPLDQLLQVLDLGVMSNAMFRGKGPAMAKGNFPTNFPLKHQQKDMKLALDLAAQKGLPLLATSSAANDNYLKALEESGDEDFSAVLKAL
jgi:3-hydroxyisobutyrate dehydrogenase-like beta-hydroxyacid dehydrogenase